MNEHQARQRKLDKLVQEEVASAIVREFTPPKGALVTVVRAQVSRTTEHARVWVSVLPAERGEEVMTALIAQIRQIQDVLNDRLVLRRVPKLLFRLDHREERAQKIEGYLDSLPKEP